jgi:ribosomal protein S18 acetylase RimI-like enzyme
MVGTIVVRRITAGDAERIRTVRLASLRSDPLAFGSTYAAEAAYSDAEWAEWAAGDAEGDELATMLALDGGDPVGVVAAYRDDDDRSLYHVIAMWVDPAYRGRGLGRELLAAIEQWVMRVGGASIQLDVADSATEAVSLYESSGYAPDGHRRPSPHTPGITHVSLRKALA